jgi:hypothetical protein
MCAERSKARQTNRSISAIGKKSPQMLSEILVRMLAGSRVWSDMPEALQILSCIDRMDKAMTGVRKSYDMLSEIAHPNWRGACTQKPIRRNSQRILVAVCDQPKVRRAVSVLLGAIDLFELAYNRISAGMPEFLAELDSFCSRKRQNQVIVFAPRLCNKIRV